MLQSFALSASVRRFAVVWRAYAPVARAAGGVANKRSPTNSLDQLRRFGGLAFAIAIGALMSMNAGMARADGRQVEAGPAAKSGSSSGSVVKRIAVMVKKSQVVDLDKAYTTALVAEAEVADVVPLSDRSIYVVGKKIGSTRLTVVGENQKILRIVEVEVTPDIDDLRAKLKENVPDADIKVTTVNGGLVLSGVVQDAPTIERAIAIAKRYAPDAVTNALGVAGPQQVMLEVRFVEAQRSAGRELGLSTRGRGGSVDWDSNQQVADPGTATAIAAQNLLSGAAPFGSLLANVLEHGMKVDLLLRALETRSLIRRLAEPNLVTTSGDTASFLAGGEFPFPVSATNGQLSIEFKKFGIALAFTPTVLSGGLINLKIAPEVSDIDKSLCVDVLPGDQVISVCGITVRRANTTVELKDGQSLAIAGLLQHGHTKEQQQLPWLGQVPVLGALFRSASFQNNETDLVIIVTPRLVKPKVPGEKLRDPLDAPMASNDVDFFANGRAEISKLDEDRRYDTKPFGHMIEPVAGEKVTHAAAK